jgi:hypothetical protein
MWDELFFEYASKGQSIPASRIDRIELTSYEKKQPTTIQCHVYERNICQKPHKQRSFVAHMMLDQHHNEHTHLGLGMSFQLTPFGTYVAQLGRLLALATKADCP